MKRIYVASSWRNTYQPEVVRVLRALDHEVYDFKHPGQSAQLHPGCPGEGGGDGFHWRAIHPDWENWTPEQYRDALQHPIAVHAFACDYGAMQWATDCLLVLPAGRSASWELGWSAGAGKNVAIYMPEKLEPELMYGGGGQAPIYVNEYELVMAYMDQDKRDRIRLRTAQKLRERGAHDIADALDPEQLTSNANISRAFEGKANA